MAGNCEHAMKRMKLGDEKLLEEFWKKDSWRTQALKSLALDLSTGHWSANATVLKIDQADANLNKPFSRALCKVSNHRFPNGKFVAESFGNIFATGIKILLDYLNNGTVPKNMYQRNALSRLAAFLESDFDWLEYTDEVSKKSRCIIMAQHLLSALSPSNSFILAKECPYIDYTCSNENICPCSRKEKLQGQFMDTSFGVPSLWHGEVDLLLEIPVLIADGQQGDDESDIMLESSRSIENDGLSGKNFTQQDKYEMRAQAISFAYTMRNKAKKNFGENAPNYLVPQIAFSKDEFCLHLYDCVNDILLTSRRFNLFQKVNNELDNLVVLLVWLALDYKELCGNTPFRLQGYKSGFHNLLSAEFIKKYSDEAVHPCEGMPYYEDEEVDCEAMLWWP